MLCLRLSTLHGSSQLAGRGRRAQAAWVALVVASLAFSWFLVWNIKDKYEDYQIYTQLDATCRVSQVPFPSVLVCSASPVANKSLVKLRNILGRAGRSQDEVTRFFSALQLLTFNDPGDGAEFPEISEILRRHYFTIDSLMEEIHQPCESLLLHCEFNRKVRRCNEVFKMIKSVEGYCCAFNYAALNDQMDELLSDSGDIEYYDERKVGAVISTSKSGKSSGLTALLNLETSDYPPWSSAQFYGARVIINDPNDYPETTTRSVLLQPREALDVKIEPQVFQSDPALQAVPVPLRSCWFHHEVLLAHTDRYSYETCRTECRMQEYLRGCSCLPYKYPKDREARTCYLPDLACVHNVTVFGDISHCNCYLECVDKKYIVRHDVTTLSPALQAHGYAPRGQVNASEVSLLKVYFEKSTCTCYKKVLVMDLTMLLGSYGGTFSLSAGGSVLTLAELGYVLLQRALAAARRLRGRCAVGCTN